MIEGGSYSKAALDKQLANYYSQIGMNQSQYYAFIRERVEAGYYQEKLHEYYHENGSGLDENEILAYYHDSVKESMEDYQAGTYSMYMQFYSMGYMSPIMFVPEGFIYIDYIQLSKDTEEEINAIIEKLNNGEMTFDELMESEDNKDPYRSKLKAPYAIGEGDFGYLSSEADFYQKAFALNIGEYDSIVVPVKGQAEEGQEAPITGYTGYLFRRAKGDMCEEGDYGIIKIDYYDGVRESVETGLREQHWMSDLKMEDAMFKYKGING